MTDNVLSRQDREEGSNFDPVFDGNGLIPAVVTHAETGAPLMVAYMNADAVALTRKTGEAHYWSRSRKELWHKGATSGQIQTVIEMLTDCDQDAIWLRVLPQGDGGCCHVGYRTCFYRKIGADGLVPTGETKLKD